MCIAPPGPGAPQLPPPHLPQRRVGPLCDLGVGMLGELLKDRDGVLRTGADHAEGGDGFPDRMCRCIVPSLNPTGQLRYLGGMPPGRGDERLKGK